MPLSQIMGAVLGYNASLKNTNMQREMNERNLLEQRRLTDLQWERDDNAYQRAIEDLRSAGLSPLAAVGNPAMNSQAIYSPGVAPQWDVSDVTQSLAGIDNDILEALKTGENARHNRKEEEAAKDELEFRTKELKSKEDQLTKTIKNHNAELIYESKTKTNQQREENSAKFISDFQKNSGYTAKIKNYQNWNDYLVAMAKATKNWQEIEEILASNPEWKKIQQSSSVSSNASGGAFSVSGGKSDSSSWSEVKNKEWYYTEAIKAWEKGAKEWPRANSDVWKSEKKREFTLPNFTAKDEELTYSE